jgi:ribosomal protein S18 acetylase RimI-like enzyme
MRITQATLEHLDLLTPLFVKYREFYGSLPYPDSSRAFLEKRLRRKESVIYLALPDDDDNKLLGFCQLYPSFSSLSLKRVWILNDIYVAEDARRQLVADNLMRTAKKMAKETQAVRMRVSTSSDNKIAQKTYESIASKLAPTRFSAEPPIQLGNPSLQTRHAFHLSVRIITNLTGCKKNSTAL